MKTTPQGSVQVTGPFTVDNGKKFRLNDFDPGDTLGYGDEDKACAKEALGPASKSSRNFKTGTPPARTPLMFHHPLQLFVNGLLANYWSKRPTV